MFLSVLFNLYCVILHVGKSGSFPGPLSAKEEEDLFSKMKNGDTEARNKLIEHNLRLVAHIVKKYFSSNDDQDDLISIGTIGLIKAIDSFNTTKNTRLATYAARCIDNEILMYFRAKKKTANDVSINEHIDTDKDGNELSLIDVISEEDCIIDRVYTKIQTEKLLKGIELKLDKREREIINLRYGLSNPPLTQKETAQKLGISRSYVSRLEKKALAELKEFMMSKTL